MLKPERAIRKADSPEQGGSAGERTRKALIEAALSRFGQFGYDGASTRDIATDAKANIGSIAYHFGGKEGLHAACAQYIVDTVQAFAAPILAQIPDPGRLEPPQAEALLHMAIDRFCGFVLTDPNARLFVSFVLRELDRPTMAFETIYSGVFEPVHSRMCKVWAAATGDDAESEATKLRVFTLIGQMVYFRIGAAAVTRRMTWQSIGPAEAAKAAGAVKSNLSSALHENRAKNRGDKS